MSGGITFSGIYTGIDYDAIIDAVINVERRRIDLVETTKTEETAELTAIRSFNTLLLGLLTSTNALADREIFENQTAASSNESILTASVTGNAAPGTQSITVNQLAQAQQLASQGFADTDTTSTGVGTVSITVGSGDTTEVEIDAGDNTLGGLRDAINNSDADVTATIINDGSASKPYRLLLTSKSTGAANTINITMSLAGGTAPDFVNKHIDSVEVGGSNNAAYTGAATASGTYTGNSNQTFLAEIMTDGAVGVATFRYSTDGGQTFNDNGGAGFLTAAGGTLMEDGVSIAFSDSGTLTGGDRFSIDTFVPTVQAAQNASITIGSGSSGGAPITIQSDSNTVTEVIPGVTLNLYNDDPSTTVRISVENNTEAIRTAVEGFVESYNGVIEFLNEQLDYDILTEEAGLLIGDSLLVSVQNDLRRTASDVIPLADNLNRLAAIGLTSVMETGKLTIDYTVLDNALNSDIGAVADLFSESYTTTDSDITYLNSTDNTVLSSSGFTVDITRAATRGTLEGTAIGGFPITLTSGDNQLCLAVDGKTSSVLTLAAQTYATGEELAAEIQDQLNADPELANYHVAVEFADGKLLFTSSVYGSSSSVGLGTEPENSAFAVLGLTGAVATSGQDVEGTINGESATGSGQILTGDSGNATTDGLALLVTLTPAEVNATDAEAEVVIIEGIAARLDDYLSFLTDSVDGRVTSRENTLTRHIDELEDDIVRMEDQLEDKRNSLIEEYARLEASLATIISQGETLTQSLSSLLAAWNYTKR